MLDKDKDTAFLHLLYFLAYFGSEMQVCSTVCMNSFEQLSQSLITYSKS